MVYPSIMLFPFIPFIADINPVGQYLSETLLDKLYRYYCSFTNKHASATTEEKRYVRY